MVPIWKPAFPQRFRARSEPILSGRGIGDPPSCLPDSARKAWVTFADELSWLTHEDRAALEIAATMRGRISVDPKAATAALFGQYRPLPRWARRLLTGRRSLSVCPMRATTLFSFWSDWGGASERCENRKAGTGADLRSHCEQNKRGVWGRDRLPARLKLGQAGEPVSYYAKTETKGWQDLVGAEVFLVRFCWGYFATTWPV